MCGCGCNTCETKSTALVLNESKAPKTILSEGLKHHIDNNKPLTEHLYRAGSSAYFNLMAEARSLYSRGILEFTNEDDLGLLTETDLGHFGMYEGKQVPLDFPIELTENELEKEKIEILDKILQTLRTSEKDGQSREQDLEDLDVSIDHLTQAITGKDAVALDFDQSNFGRFATIGKSDKKKLKEAITNIIDEKKKAKKKDNRPIGKPMRSSSGGKAYKVYVKDPKTKKVKTVRFGSGGLRAKINDSKARKAFAARHKCSQKKDRTKASYWSCRLPRYAKLLGLKSSFSGFW
mgnify:CR=1 FL=1